VKLLEYSPFISALIAFPKGKVLSPRKIVRSQIMQPGQAQALSRVCYTFVVCDHLAVEGLIGSRLSEVERAVVGNVDRCFVT
jgi:hypothetical protein